MNYTATGIAGAVNELASLPDIALRISDLLDDENSSAWDIGVLIEQDPGLSAALLRIANSALYNQGVPITAIDRAVTVVGAGEVRDLSFGVCTSIALQNIPRGIVSIEEFWHQSLACAAASKSIGKALSITCKDSLFMAGLLHNIGQLVMVNQCPDEMQEALAASTTRAKTASSHLDEQAIFGFDHGEVGAVLMAQWGLPVYLQHAARYHHEPHRAEPHARTVVDIVHVADAIGRSTISGGNIDDYMQTVDPEALARTRLLDSELPIIVEETKETVSQLISVFAH